MKKQQYSLFLIISGIFFISCDRNDNIITQQPAPIHFSSIMTVDGWTRASGTSWDNGDKIGVFTIKHPLTLQPENIYDHNENLPFITNGDGNFYAQNKNIYYPEDGSSIDVIAYFPYRSELDGYNYAIDITKQADFFYCDNLQDISKESQQNGTLKFRRPLSKITLSITPKDLTASLDGLSVLLTGVKTKASFSLSDGTLSVEDQPHQSIGMEVSGSSKAKQAAAIVLPTEGENTVAVQFQIGNNTFTWAVPNDFEAGKAYHYDIVLEISPSNPESLGSYMEIPVYTASLSAPHSVLALHMVEDKKWLNSGYSNSNPSVRNYTVMFDTENRLPYWVAYPMHPMYLASGNRTDAWDYDPLIPHNVQPNLYSGWSSKILNRGHLLASADRNATREINKTTFYFTNMAPQNGDMNGVTWAALEERVRSWCKQTAYDTLYVVTGCILPKSPELSEYVSDNDGKKSAVPKYLYKALLKKNKSTGKYTSIVFKMENASTGIPYTDSRNIISVAELEEETGFAFFTLLPKEVGAQVKQNKAMSPDWN